MPLRSSPDRGGRQKRVRGQGGGALSTDTVRTNGQFPTPGGIAAMLTNIAIDHQIVLAAPSMTVRTFGSLVLRSASLIAVLDASNTNTNTQPPHRSTAIRGESPYVPTVQGHTTNLL